MTNDQHPPTDSDAAGERFVEHFEPILCETDEDRELLERLTERVRDFTVKPVQDEIQVELEKPSVGVQTVVCESPYEGDVDASVPASFATLAGHHNGITWDRGMFGFPGLALGGDLRTFSLSPDWLDNERNEAHGEALAAEGLDFGDVREALLAGQNWIVFDPLEENARGEPPLAFVDHGVCELEPIPEAEDLATGQVVLRLMAHDFLEDYSLDPVWL